MYTVEQLKNLQDKSNTAVKTMENIAERLNALIASREADKSRSQSYIAETVAADREKVLPALAAELQIIRDATKEAAGQQQFWVSRPLLLSLQTFADDPAKDATIRTGHAAELSTMPAPLLNLTFQNAREDKNLPMIYACWRAGMGRSNEAGFTDMVDMSIDGIDIPDQAPALAAISVCGSNVGHAEMIAAVATGLRTDPVRKMTVARQQQASSRLVDAAAALDTEAQRIAGS